MLRFDSARIFLQILKFNLLVSFNIKTCGLDVLLFSELYIYIYIYIYMYVYIALYFFLHIFLEGHKFIDSFLVFETNK